MSVSYNMSQLTYFSLPTCMTDLNIRIQRRVVISQDLLKGLEYNPMGIDKQCGPGQQANNQTGNVCKSLKCVNQTSGLVSEFKTGALLGTHCGLDDGNRGICERWQCVDKEVPDLCPKCDVTIEDSTSSTVEIIVDIVEKVTSIWDQLRKLFHF